MSVCVCVCVCVCVRARAHVCVCVYLRACGAGDQGEMGTSGYEGVRTRASPCVFPQSVDWRQLSCLWKAWRTITQTGNEVRRRAHLSTRTSMVCSVSPKKEIT